MNKEDYTPNQIEDIQKRTVQAQAYLKGMNLFPAAIVQKVQLGEDVFADKVICYLQDSKFTPIKSPIQKDDIPTS